MRYSSSLQWLWKRISTKFSRGMLLSFWAFLYWTTLCCSQGKGQEYFSSVMKKSDSQKLRRMIREAFCYDINGNKVQHGEPFVPEGNDFCYHCKCLSGQAGQCFTTECAVPTCKDYKAVPGKCCAYTCPSASGVTSEAAELAIIISLSVGLVLLLILLVFVIDRNRKKNQRNRMRSEVLEQSQNLRPRPLNNRLAVTAEENGDGIEPPPPYTPGRGRYSIRKPQYASPPFTPNEPPPPYEINSREATDV